MTELGRFTKVATTGEVAPGEMISVEVNGEQVVLCNVGGEFYAVHDECTHERFPLSEGTLEGQAVVCTLHGARFSLETGEVLAPPALVPVRTYEVRVEGEDVLVAVGDE
ncbi:MAG: Rieske 2Fe-2S domain-containing protein [Gemmatimonadetes bacterium]|nr:Rieske 2Fe-2S domain-containing protein [Gemmatimonadota bacterium]NIO30651.1 Rieske 2Fe-2S domain-containing protein [Gemmatimonadota bacterium]